jgi:hypothetical protein
VVDELNNSDKHKWLFKEMTRAQNKIFQIYDSPIPDGYTYEKWSQRAIARNSLLTNGLKHNFSLNVEDGKLSIDDGKFLFQAKRIRNTLNGEIKELGEKIKKIPSKFNKIKNKTQKTRTIDQLHVFEYENAEIKDIFDSLSAQIEFFENFDTTHTRGGRKNKSMKKNKKTKKTRNSRK